MNTIGTQTEKPVRTQPVDVVVELYNGLFLTIKENREMILELKREIKNLKGV